MNRFLKKLTLGTFLLLGLSTGAAVATPVFNYDISGTFEDPYHPALPGGTFNGTFSATGTLNASNVFTNYSLTAADINVTTFGPDLGGHTFANLDYTL